MQIDGSFPPGPFCSSEMAAFGGKTKTAEINDDSVKAGAAKATAVDLAVFYPGTKIPIIISGRFSFVTGTTFLSLARQAAVPPPHFVTVGAFTVWRLLWRI